MNRFYNDDYYVFKNDVSLSLQAEKDYKKFIHPYKEKHKSLLEIGCAKGHLLRRAQNDGWIVAGVEISEFASNIARNKFNLDVFTGTIEDLNFSERCFDLIVGFDVIEHVEDPINFLICLRKLLNYNGTIFMDSPNPQSIFSKLTGGAWVGFNAYHLQLLGFKSWQLASYKSGLMVKNIRTDHFDFFSPEERWRLRKFFHIRGFNRLMNLLNYFSFTKKACKTFLERKLGDQWLVELQNS
ncbi:MAG: class I SAM-dependent methyltransferase [Thermodesulfobacteriota bacterium]|nr:class I SAM-dependent methyltransferase [Thermodesulfobacteriota bacterium]